MGGDLTFGSTPGVVHTVAEGVRRILAPNPSAMTGPGTNTYLIGEGEVTLIDPGPDSGAHLRAILAALRPRERIGRILVTHGHLDHSGLTRRLAEMTGAPVMAFGDNGAGRSPVMARLAGEGIPDGGEGKDHAFRPDETLADGATVLAGGAVLRAVHTPGHFGNHLCFRWNDLIFSGDHVMGWSTSLVSPPDGDMGAYMTSLDRLEAECGVRLLPGHGEAIENPHERIVELRAHRLAREAQILSLLTPQGQTADEITRLAYAGTPTHLLKAASRNVLAHLIDLWTRAMVSARPVPGTTALWTLA